jgi:hypothetical protein
MFGKRQTPDEIVVCSFELLNAQLARMRDPKKLMK